LKKGFKSLSKFQSNAEHWLSLGGGIAVALMMVIGTVDVVLRKIFAYPLPGSYEFVSLSFVVVVFWSLAEIQRENGHIKLSSLYNKFPRRGKVYILGTTLFLSAGISVLATLSTARDVIWAFEAGDVIMGLINVVTWPSRLAIAIGTGFLSWRLITQFVQLIRQGDLLDEDSNKAEIPLEKR
jgi:TRAP-type C4-dicarboxylate transport system permease small subunit